MAWFCVPFLLIFWPAFVSSAKFDGQPDFTVNYTLDDDSERKMVQLAAFKTNENSLFPKWGSFGYPYLSKTDNYSMVFKQNDSITIFMRTLDDQQKAALVQAAKRKYPTLHISTENFVPLWSSGLFFQFGCDWRMTKGGFSLPLKGIGNFSSNGSVIVPIAANSITTSVLMRQINSSSFLIECRLAAANSTTKPDILKVPAADMRRLTDEVFTTHEFISAIRGATDAESSAHVLETMASKQVFVTYSQLDSLSKRVWETLKFEEYMNDLFTSEMEFRSEFIEEIKKAANASFSPLLVELALRNLSLYKTIPLGYNASTLLHELAGVFEVKAGSTKKFIAPAYCPDQYENICTAIQQFDLSHEAFYVQRKSRVWATDNSTLVEQLKELNDQTKSGIVWKLDDPFVRPESFIVLSVTRETLEREFALPSYTKWLQNPPYSVKYKFETAGKPGCKITDKYCRYG